MQQPAVFQPALPRPPDYGATEQENKEKISEAGDIENPAAMVSKSAFKRGVAMTHSFLLFAIFVPPFMLCLQMSYNTDLAYFVGCSVARLAYAVVVLVLLVPMAHLTTRLHPWAFLLTVWVPAFIFVGIGWHYRDATSGVVNALQSIDCVGFAEKRSLQNSYNQAQALYNKCGKFVTYSSRSAHSILRSSNWQHETSPT